MPRSNEEVARLRRLLPNPISKFYRPTKLQTFAERHHRGLTVLSCRPAERKIRGVSWAQRPALNGTIDPDVWSELIFQVVDSRPTRMAQKWRWFASTEQQSFGPIHLPAPCRCAHPPESVGDQQTSSRPLRLPADE